MLQTILFLCSYPVIRLMTLEMYLMTSLGGPDRRMVTNAMFTSGVHIHFLVGNTKLNHDTYLTSTLTRTW